MTMTREHFLSVAIAKYAFLHPIKGVVYTADPLPLDEAKRFGLSPLVLYAVSVAELPISAIRFSTLDKPLSIVGFLKDAWSSAPGLMGMPTELRISRACAAADEGFVAALTAAGIRVKVAESSDKSLPAALRNAQSEPREMSWRASRIPSGTLQELNAAAATVHQEVHDQPYWSVRTTAKRELLVDWLKLKRIEPAGLQDAGLDWKPGTWLSAWEVSVPRGIHRIWGADQDGGTWLYSGQRDDIDDVDDVEPDIDDDPSEATAFDEFAVEEAKSLINCWPGGKQAVAQAIGITVKELSWAMAGRKELDPGKRSDLMAILGMELDEESGYYEAEGPCILIGKSPMHTKEAYNALSKGGDLAFSIDAVPDKGIPDPSWQYLMFMPHGQGPSIIMIPRGSKLSATMATSFINFNGTHQIPEKLYRDIVSTCAMVGREPGRNIELSAELHVRQILFIESIEDNFDVGFRY